MLDRGRAVGPISLILSGNQAYISSSTFNHAGFYSMILKMKVKTCVVTVSRCIDGKGKWVCFSANNEKKIVQKRENEKNK